MIACPSCGYPNGESDYRCERCGRRFEAVTFQTPFTGTFDDGEAPPPTAVSRPRNEPAPAGDEPPEPARGDAATGPEVAVSAGEAPWRSELSSRVERFRQRRLAQAYLPFESDSTELSQPAEAPAARDPAPRFGGRKVIPFEEIAGAHAAAHAPAATSPSPAAPPAPEPLGPRAGVLEAGRHSAPAGPGTPRASAATTPLSPPTASAPGAWPEAGAPAVAVPPRASRKGRSRSSSAAGPGDLQAGFAFPETRPLAFAGERVPIGPTIDVDVAPLAARAVAAAFDVAFLAAGHAVFFVCYALAGGRLPVQRTGLAALMVAALVLAFTYFLLFLVFAGATPGMRWIGLRLVDFEGRRALRGQRTLRLLAMAASAAALGFGFLWAIADEDELTWHDRVSQTCLTLDESVFQRRSGSRL